MAGDGGLAVSAADGGDRDRMDKAALEQALGPIDPSDGRDGPGTGPVGGQPDPAQLEADFILKALRILGLVLGGLRRTSMGWGHDIRCPWSEEHTDRVDAGAVYVPIHGRFQCMHGHCQDRRSGDMRARVNQKLQEDSGGTVSLATLEFDAVGADGGGTNAGGINLASYEATEDGLALAFADQHRLVLRFDHTRGRWYVWTGDFWQQDGTARAADWAHELAREFRAGLHDATPAQIRAWGKIAVGQAIERRARATKALAIDGLSWDQDPFLAGIPGGELDLKTGAISPADPAHLISRQLLVAPRAMPTPLWDQFLWDSTGGDTDTIGFLQAWSGYCLTGDTTEEKFVFLYGPGGNGKGTFLFTLSAIAGDYGARTPADTFMTRKHDAHPEEIARLAGARMVTSSELEGGRSFNVARLKDFTGRDGQLTGRFMRENTFAFLPQFKLIFVGNNQPRLAQVDDAMRRRTVLIPFTQKPGQADITLKDRLAAEYPGILHWMIAGEQNRRATGGISALVPAAAAQATRAYLDAQDTLKNWTDERLRDDPKGRVGVREALEDYKMWCNREGAYTTITKQDFSGRLLAMKPNVTKSHTKNGEVLVGVSLSPQVVAF